MEKDKFNAVFPIICSSIIEKMVNELNIPEEKAITELYLSSLYGKLEQEESKIWQYSTEKLFDLFLEERNTGKITFPEF